jgi:hypothetical protein
MSSSGQPPVSSNQPPLGQRASQQAKQTSTLKKFGTAFVLALIVLAIYYVGGPNRFTATTAWEITLGLLIVLCLYLGWVISGRFLGILVGNRNLMSLSRFQIVAWTIVILSAFLTIAFRRIFDPSVTAPLDMPMDPHLWALLGISTASLVGTPLILQNKAAKAAAPATVNKAAATLGENSDEVKSNLQGTLYVNTSIQDARVTDMFEGDEIGNTAYVDIAKVQMFLFTIIIVVSYCCEVHNVLRQLDLHQLSAKDLLMPALSSGVVGLLGISHAGYLGNKAADHTPTQPASGS